MDCPRYDGNIHPEEYIKEMRAYCEFKRITDEHEILKFSKMMIDSTINLPTEMSEIGSCEELINVLKEHITFTIFKSSCKRKLRLLRYNVERDGGDTPKFISNFRSLCRGAEINDIKDGRGYLYNTLPNDFFRNEFIKRYDTIDSLNELMICFEDTLTEYTQLIRSGSKVAIKHLVTGKYLSSWSRCYATGSKGQMVFCGQTLQDSNAVWVIRSLDSSELLSYGETIFFQHKNTENYLDVHTKRECKSPVSDQTEVSCGSNDNYRDLTWSCERVSSESGEFLKTNDVVIIKNQYHDYLYNKESVGILSSLDVKFAVDGDDFQEVYSRNSNGKTDENDKWCIELLGKL